MALSTATLWLWHAPALYDLALKYEWVHRLEHVLFLATALLYLRPLLGGGHYGALDSNAKRTLYLVAGAMQGGLLGGLIALGRQILCIGYLTEIGASQSAHADQELGGYVVLRPNLLQRDCRHCYANLARCVHCCDISA